MDKKDEALKLALGYMDGTLVTNHLIGYERKRHVTETIREALAEQPAQQERNFCPRCGKRVGSNDWDLHTCTPPQRTRAGLTDEKIEEIAAKTLFPVPFARAIEAKLKEKNT